MLFVNGDFEAVGLLAERHPGLRLVLDHMGAHVEQRGAAAFEHLDALLRLARSGNLAVKASALPCAAEDGYPHRSVEPFLKATFDAFGPERTFWRSEPTRLPRAHRDAVTMFTEHLPWRGGTDMAEVMGASLCRWLDWKT